MSSGPWCLQNFCAEFLTQKYEETDFFLGNGMTQVRSLSPKHMLLLFMLGRELLSLLAEMGTASWGKKGTSGKLYGHDSCLGQNLQQAEHDGRGAHS